jgi:hypothetical protein
MLIRQPRAGGGGAGGGGAAGPPPMQPVGWVQPARPVARAVHRFLGSYAELCVVRDVPLEGLYLRRWCRAAVTGADDAGVRLEYLDSGDTKVLQPADFEAGSWRVCGG